MAHPKRLIVMHMEAYGLSTEVDLAPALLGTPYRHRDNHPLSQDSFACIVADDCLAMTLAENRLLQLVLRHHNIDLPEVTFTKIE